MAKTFDLTIIGAGIIGLASALKIKRKYPELRLSIIEKETSIARHQSGNNSGVIHSGIYYKPGSLKALNCKKGYSLMLDFLNEHKIPYQLCGKIIVATDEFEIERLNDIYKRGVENDLQDMKVLDNKEIKEIEPHVAGTRAIYVPQAGITDYKLVSEQYRKLLEDAGVSFFFNQEVEDLKIKNGIVQIKTIKNDFYSKEIINCGGLYSDKLAGMTVTDLNYKIIPFRGEYYNLKPSAYRLVKGLVYPVPDPNFPFLGVHFTKTIHGGIESGPNAVFAFSREGYRKRDINLSELMESLKYPGFQVLVARHWKTGSLEMYRSFSKKAFVNSLKKLIPEINENDVVKGGAGVRAQAVKKDGLMVDDFLILRSENIINVCNAPSPAATASLAIGEHISTYI